MIYKLLYLDGVEHIFQHFTDGQSKSFMNTEDNDSIERSEYLKWLAEGNTPEVIDL